MSERRLRPRTVSELVDALVEILRQHYPALMTVTAVGMAPIVALGAVAAVVGVSLAKEGGPWAGPLVAAFVLGVLVMLAAIAVTASALMVAISDAYIHDRVDAAAAFRTGWRRLPATIGGFLLMSVAGAVGFLCLIVGAFYVYAALFALPAIVLLEERGPVEAFSRSWELSKGRKLPILGAIFLVGIITSVVSNMVQMGAMLTLGPVAGVVAQIVMFLLLFPASTAMPVLLYYDARVRKEGLDIELEAASLLQATPAPPAAPAV